MPTYEYHCETCDEYFELRQSFTDDPIVECLDTDCIRRVKKVFGNVGIAFKGSGFYKTDSRSTVVASAQPSKRNRSAARRYWHAKLRRNLVDDNITTNAELQLTTNACYRTLLV